MHILLILLILALLIYLILNNRGESPPSSQWDENEESIFTRRLSAPSKDQELAFLSKGNLYLRDRGEHIKQIHSPYIQDVIDRMEKSKKLHGWKQDTSFGTSFTGRGVMEKGDNINIKFVSAVYRGAGRLLYCLTDKTFGGLFEYDLESGQEKRLMHTQNASYEDLAFDRQNEKLLCSEHQSTGTANIVLFDLENDESREITGGDTMDTAPSWVHDSGHHIVYQSTGIARSDQGFVIAHGPASIQMLDLSDGSLTPILEDGQADYLQPKIDVEGNLYFIRRPYEQPKYGTKNMFVDAVLFPFRLLRAVFHFLNFFSVMYSRKPLTSASGPQVQADLKDILLKGKRIDAENALKKAELVCGVPSLVPRSWQLVCKNKRGAEKVLATNVASFDLTEDGGIIYSNGCGVFQYAGTNKPDLLLKDELVSEVVGR